MAILRYDEQHLAEQLASIPVRYRVTFAAACAERLLLAYADFSRRTGRGDPARLGAILERLWRDLEGDEMTSEQINQQLEACMNLIPQEGDGPWVPEQAFAEDAAAALAYTIRCRQTGDSQEAAWAARHAYEALDHFVIGHEGIDTNGSGAEERVLSHPLVQAELTRQRRDVGELLAATETEMASLVGRIRKRARAESDTLFRIKG